MKVLVVAIVALACTVSGTIAQEQTPVSEDRPLISETETLDSLLWEARPVVVFADSPNDPRFVKQMELLNARKQELFDRDVVVITDTDPDTLSPLRKQLRPRGFMLVLIGKDGQVVIRKPAPWDVRELTRQIDKMPLRKQEIRDRTGLSN